MKKETILEALKNAGIELDEDKQKEFIKTIQIANGVDIEVAKKGYADKEQELAELKAKYESDLKVKDEALKQYNDVEIAELRKFKADTIQAQKNAVQETAINELIGKEEYHFDKKAIPLLSVVAKTDIKFDDDNKITNADEVMSKLIDKYKDFVVSTTVDGAQPDQKKKDIQEIDLDKMSVDEYREYRKKSTENQK